MDITQGIHILEQNDTVNYKNEPINKAFLQFLELHDKNRFSPKVVQRLWHIVQAVQSEKGINRQKIITLLQVSASTAARYIKLLCQANILVFKGAAKTGHYEWSPDFQQSFNSEQKNENTN